MVMDAVEEIEYEGLPPNAGLGVSALSSTFWFLTYPALIPGQHDGWSLGEFSAGGGFSDVNGSAFPRLVSQNMPLCFLWIV